MSHVVGFDDRGWGCGYRRYVCRNPDARGPQPLTQLPDPVLLVRHERGATWSGPVTSRDTADCSGLRDRGRLIRGVQTVDREPGGELFRTQRLT